jgi:hypothetical protein
MIAVGGAKLETVQAYVDSQGIDEHASKADATATTHRFAKTTFRCEACGHIAQQSECMNFVFSAQNRSNFPKVTVYGTNNVFCHLKTLPETEPALW